MIKLEICTGSLASVYEAHKGGATRIELCDNLGEGGTTPPLSWIEKSLELYDLQAFTLIRARGGDFLYSDNEIDSMKRDIINCGEAGCHGVVIGALAEDGNIDMQKSKELVDLAKRYNMSVTFHRAIDRTQDIFKAVKDVINLGCDRILTSGGAATVAEGKDTINKMIELAAGRIIILPGGGINEENIAELASTIRTNEFHGSFRKRVVSKMKYIKEGVDSYENDYTTMVSCADKIRKAIKNANAK